MSPSFPLWSCFRLVKNFSRRQEGFMTASSLQRSIGGSSGRHSSRLGGKRKTSSWASLVLHFDLSVLRACVFYLQTRGPWRRGSSAPRRADKHRKWMGRLPVGGGRPGEADWAIFLLCPAHFNHPRGECEKPQTWLLFIFHFLPEAGVSVSASRTINSRYQGSWLVFPSLWSVKSTRGRPAAAAAFHSKWTSLKIFQPFPRSSL